MPHSIGVFTDLCRVLLIIINALAFLTGHYLSENGWKLRHSRVGGNPESAGFKQSGFRVSTLFRPK